MHGRQVGAEAAGGVGEREVEVLQALEEPLAPVDVGRGGEIAQVVEAVGEPDEELLGWERGLLEAPAGFVAGGLGALFEAVVGRHGTQASGEPGAEVLGEQCLRFGSHFQGVVEEGEEEGLMGADPDLGAQERDDSQRVFQVRGALVARVAVVNGEGEGADVAGEGLLVRAPRGGAEHGQDVVQVDGVHPPHLVRRAVARGSGTLSARSRVSPTAKASRPSSAAAARACSAVRRIGAPLRLKDVFSNSGSPVRSWNCSWRSTLHLIFEDAIDEGLITSNPAARRRGRGKRAGRSRDRGPEKVVTDALGILLTAERAALLSGRDDEFVAVVLKGYTGIRWGEIVGLETAFVRPGAVRVEWQLYELDTGELVRCPPKDDSYRTIASTDWLSALVANHTARTKPKPCPCHGKTYVFRGQGAARTGGHQGAKLVDVARRASVSTGTVSNVLNHPERVTEATREKVEQAIADLRFVRGGVVPEHAAHWRRNGFATWLFTPAVSGEQ